MYVEKPDAALKFISALKRKSRSLAHVDLVLAPSYTLLGAVAAATKPARSNSRSGGNSFVRVAGQALSPYEDRAHTGGVSAAMLKAVGATWTIVGHSERRGAPGGAGLPAQTGESNESVRAQVMRAQEEGLGVILCIGEAERDPSGTHFSVVAGQLASALQSGVAGKPGVVSSKLVIAYEPVWAIGKSSEDAMHPGDLREMVIFIRKTLADILGRPAGVRIPILYGGSVDATNAAPLLQEGDIAGFLVGRASADIDSFLELLAVCKK